MKYIKRLINTETVLRLFESTSLVLIKQRKKKQYNQHYQAIINFNTLKLFGPYWTKEKLA